MGENLIEAYPLHWPIGYDRATKRKDSQFKQTLGKARDYLKNEVRRIGGTNLVISTNLPTKGNGDLRADFGRYKIDDPGVAVYFKRNGQDVCLCTDTYHRVWENVYALARSIEAMRQIERDGVPSFLNRAFTGFKALPEATTAEKEVWQILGLNGKPETRGDVKEAYRLKAIVLHPDKPTGSVEAFHNLQDAYRKAINFF